MAITYDAQSSGQSSGSVSTLTVSHTCSSNSYRALLVFAYDSSSKISSCTYNGVSMTKLFNSNTTRECFYLANPANGANNIVLTRSSASSDVMTIQAVSFYDCNTSSLIGNSSGVYTQITGSTTPSYDFTTAYDNSIIVCQPWCDQYPITFNATGTNHTERCTDLSQSGGTLIVTTKLTSADGSYTLNWSKDNTKTAYAMFVELRELVVVAPTVSTSACDQVESTSARGNGNITNTGGASCTRRGFCYKAASSGDPTTSDSTAYDDGTYSTGAYTKTISGLSAGTQYRVRAYAVNSAGTGYGTTVNLTTSSAGPANVKTYKGLAAASVKTCKGLAVASIKTKKGLN